MQRTANRPYAWLLDYSKSLVIRAVADLILVRWHGRIATGRHDGNH